MNKKEFIKKITSDMLLEKGDGKFNPHVKIGADKEDDNKLENDDYDELTNMLIDNDIFNWAAIARRLKGEPWDGNTDATNRSLFGKKLKREKSPEGDEYKFSDDTLSQIRSIMNSLATSINSTVKADKKK